MQPVQRILVAFIATLLAVWIVPAMLDWNRYRTSIAGFAAAELGRPVVIDGDVTLRLLPRAVLTASDVTFPDQGDGVSAHLRALRLEVAIAPLLGGHLVVRDLVLGEPVLRLPWPLPPTLGTPVRPYVRHPFTARVEQGGVKLGAVALTGITAAVQSVAATGALRITGAADFAGAPWRFVTALGTPDPAGSATLDIAVDGDGPFANTSGRFTGSLSAGSLNGHTEGQGPDLSRLLTAPAGPWHASGPFAAVAGLLELPDLALTLAGAADAHGRIKLHVTDPAGLELGLSAGALDVAAWAAALATMQRPALPMHVMLDAAHARLLGGDARNLHADVALDPAGMRLQQVHITLPGQAILTLTGEAGRDRDGFWAAGPATLDAPELHATLAWLRPLAPTLIRPPHGAALSRARLAGTLRLSPRTLSLSGMSGSVDDSQVSGGFGIGLTQAGLPGFGAGIVLDRLQLDEVAGAAMEWPRFDGDVYLRAASVTWRGQDIGAVDAFLHSDARGLVLPRLALQGEAGRLSMSGTLGTDGSLSDVHLTAATQDLDRLGSAAARLGLPHALVQPGLWQGDASMEMTAAGPPHAWGVQLRADAGDLHVETEATIDAATPRGTATVTIRHPGAPRLLAALGAAHAERWLDSGSFALLAHLALAPGRLTVRDFDLTAASLRLFGSLDVPLAEAWPMVAGSINADMLPLPWLEALPASWFTGWNGRLRVRAEAVTADLRPVARALQADVTVQNGMVLADDVAARIGDTGSVTGQAAADLAGAPARVATRLTIAGARLTGPATGLPIDITGGLLAGDVSLYASGADAAEWSRSCSGSFSLRLDDAQITGIDLSRITRLAAARQPSARGLAAALTSGQSDALSGALAGEIDRGRLTVEPATLTGDAGALGVTGSLALDGSGVDITIGATPGIPSPPPLRVHLSGPSTSVHADTDIGALRRPPARRGANHRPARPH